MRYRVKLDIFDGPLDLLLYLIRKEELDISEVSVSLVASQYLEYIDLMRTLDLDFAGEYLVTAATLVHMKSNSLLPDKETEAEEESRELVNQLLEYKKYKEVAGILQEKEQARLNVFTRPEPPAESRREEVLLDVSLFDLLGAFSKVLNRIEPGERIREIVYDEFTVKEKIRFIQDILRREPVVNFTGIFERTGTRLEAVVTFLAVLDLIKLREIKVKQSGEFGEIYIYRKTDSEQPVL